MNRPDAVTARRLRLNAEAYARQHGVSLQVARQVIWTRYQTQASQPPSVMETELANCYHILKKGKPDANHP